jgi:hypothetical protein
MTCVQHNIQTRLKHDTCFKQREYNCSPEDTTRPVSFRNSASINYWNLIRIDTAALEKIDILFFQANLNDLYFWSEKLHIHGASTHDGWIIVYERNPSDRSGTSEGHTLHSWRGKGALKTCESVQILIFTSLFYSDTKIGSMDIPYIHRLLQNVFGSLSHHQLRRLVTFTCTRLPVFPYWPAVTYWNAEFLVICNVEMWNH